jgi:hypothetical protein
MRLRLGIEYIVKQGECISNIALSHGLTPDKIWNHPKNSKLKKIRKDENILLPGDTVYVPEKQFKEESFLTEKRQLFRKLGYPVRLQIQLLDAENESRSGIDYIISIDGDIYRGVTDSDGWIKKTILPNAIIGKLIVIDEDNEEEYELKLGYLNPSDEITGAQQRLNNLGFDCGNEKGNLGPQTKESIEQFQKRYNLDKTGALDSVTVSKLKEVYGC